MISAFATATATMVLITPPFERKVSKNQFIFWSKELSINGPPLFKK